MSNIDNVVPKDTWKFDEDVAECFENMLERSIPQYDTMRDSVAMLAYNMIYNDIKKDTFSVLDLGCSDGLMIQKMREVFGNKGHYTGIDISEPMLNKAKYRFLDDIISNNVSIRNCDLRNDFPSGYFDIITAILSIQFTPIEYRQHIIQNVYNHLSGKNSCFIMVEKVLGNSDRLNKLFVENYYGMKIKNGYSQEQIDRKRLSLEGVLVPVTNDWNIELLRQAGFREVDVFWRWMNFVGYIAIK
jgi:tRNA (cmo5U34)-methyltransferase